MTTNIKYIHLVGIEKREVILIKSFLNLAKGEMNVEYMIDEDQSQRPDLFIVEEISHHDEINRGNEHAEVLVIGADLHNKETTYLHRPLQWSRFKSALDRINQATTGNATYELSVEKTAQVVEIQGADEDQAGAKSFRSDSDFIINDSIVDGHASEDGGIVVNENTLPVVTSGVKTDTKKHVTVLDVGHEETESSLDVRGGAHEYEDTSLDDEAQSFEKIDRLGKKIEFWDDDDCQVIVKDTPVLFVKAQKQMVYSEYPSTDWEILLRSRDAGKVPLPEDWEPSGRMKSFPLSWLIWYASHARSKGYLDDELDKEHFFLLETWPQFDLLYTNNDHLKLCGLLFKEGQSIQELVSRTHLRARVIIALINACHKLGILSSFPDKDSAKPRVSDDSMDTHTVMSLLSKVFKTDSKP